MKSKGMNIIRLACIYALLLSNPAHAAYLTGNTAQKWCEESDNLLLGYVGGVLDGYATGSAGFNVKGLYDPFLDGLIDAGKLCIPPQVTVRQLRDIFCKSLNENPKERHKPGSTILINAIHTSYPCK
jgi:hypothetical protein